VATKLPRHPHDGVEQNPLFLSSQVKGAPSVWRKGWGASALLVTGFLATSFFGARFSDSTRVWWAQMFHDVLISCYPVRLIANGSGVGSGGLVGACVD